MQSAADSSARAVARRRSGGPNPTEATGFASLLQVREFRWLWLADLQSLLGDQLARVALAILVFDDTRSGLLTAGVYALTYLPALVGSVVLGPFADRVPRRRLLVLLDLMRAALLATMAVPGVPLGVVACLLVVAVVIGTPWKAAESALVADILRGQGYALGTGLRIATVQGSQLLGFAVGGAVVGSVGARSALAIDAVTFAVSAAMIGLRLGPRPAPDAGRRAPWSDGLRVVAGNRVLRSLLGLSWLAGVFVIPEGLAAPYAAHLGGGAVTTGILLAAGPAGVMVGALVFVRAVPDAVRARLVGPLAVAAGLPLLACVLDPGLTVTAVLWALCGVCSAYQAQVITEFVQAVPDHRRGQAVAVASGGLLAVQGIGLLLGGLATEAWTMPATVAGAGALGVVLAAVAATGRAGNRRQSERVDAAPR